MGCYFSARARAKCAGHMAQGFLVIFVVDLGKISSHFPIPEEFP